MSEIWMRGNGPLEGEVKVQGSKNAALPMMAAAVLHEGRTVLHNCPRIADVFEMEAILPDALKIRHRGSLSRKRRSGQTKNRDGFSEMRHVD